jgi:hypothetical protein
MVGKERVEPAYETEIRQEKMTIDLICPSCHFSKKVPRAKIPLGARWAICPRCHQRFEFLLSERSVDVIEEETGPPTDSENAGDEFRKGSRPQGAPWERRSEVGLWQGIYQTLKAVLFSPKALFSTMTFNNGIREPLAFGLLVGSLGSMFGLFWHFLMLTGGLIPLGESILGQFTMLLIFLLVMVIVPFFVMLGIFIYSGILHLLLLMVRGGKNRYEATFRVISYSQAAHAWGLIPFIGGWIGGIWQLVVQIIGLRVIHETSYFRVIIAFLIPVALIFLLAIAAVVSLFIFITQRWFV